jgi:hypothetical protein
MSQAPGWLSRFRDRLAGGVHDSLARTRPGDRDVRDAQVLGGWPAGKFPVLNGIRDVPWDPGDEPRATIDRLTSELAADRKLLTAVIFSPDRLLDRLAGLGGETERDMADCWLGMYWVAEAAWAVIKGAGGRTPDDAAVLRPVAARLRFLVLSEPMRWRARPAGPWTADPQFGGNGIFGRALGPGSWDRVVDSCREARHEWQGCLDAYQSHPLLRHADPQELERELRTLVFRDDDGDPLGLSVAPLGERAGLTADDSAVITDAVELHLLPRFAIAAVARLMLHDDSRHQQRLRALIAAAVVSCGLGAVGYAADLQVHPAVRFAAACYVLVGLGVLVLPAGWGTMWLLRMPAASAVGIIALVAFLPGGWLQTPPGGWTAVVVLVAVAFGYLLIEVRNHGVARLAAAPRALLVIVIGAVHAVLVSLIGLTVVAPAFVADGGQLNKLWTHPGYEHAGMVLALAAAWCLAIGVFSQILWDDRPITAPLAHLSWRG